MNLAKSVKTKWNTDVPTRNDSEVEATVEVSEEDDNVFWDTAKTYLELITERLPAYLSISSAEQKWLATHTSAELATVISFGSKTDAVLKSFLQQGFVSKQVNTVMKFVKKVTEKIDTANNKIDNMIDQQIDIMLDEMLPPYQKILRTCIDILVFKFGMYIPEMLVSADTQLIFVHMVTSRLHILLTAVTGSLREYFPPETCAKHFREVHNAIDLIKDVRTPVQFDKDFAMPLVKKFAKALAKPLVNLCFKIQNPLAFVPMGYLLAIRTMTDMRVTSAETVVDLQITPVNQIVAMHLAKVDVTSGAVEPFFNRVRWISTDVALLTPSLRLYYTTLITSHYFATGLLSENSFIYYVCAYAHQKNMPIFTKTETNKVKIDELCSGIAAASKQLQQLLGQHQIAAAKDTGSVETEYHELDACAVKALKALEEAFITAEKSKEAFITAKTSKAPIITADAIQAKLKKGYDNRISNALKRKLETLAKGTTSLTPSDVYKIQASDVDAAEDEVDTLMKQVVETATQALKKAGDVVKTSFMAVPRPTIDNNIDTVALTGAAKTLAEAANAAKAVAETVDMAKDAAERLTMMRICVDGVVAAKGGVEGAKAAEALTKEAKAAEALTKEAAEALVTVVKAAEALVTVVKATEALVTGDASSIPLSADADEMNDILQKAIDAARALETTAVEAFQKTVADADAVTAKVAKADEPDSSKQKTFLNKLTPSFKTGFRNLLSTST
jgi:hypothetical protein